MNKDQNGKKAWYRTTSFLIISGILLVGIGYGIKALLMPKPLVVKYNLYECGFTEAQQEKIFSNPRVTEIRFDWIAEPDGSGKLGLRLRATGSYNDGSGNPVLDISNAVELTKKGKICADVPSDKYNFKSPIYMTRGDIRELNNLPLGEETPLTDQDITTDILMTPQCTSDPSRNNNLYYGGSTGYGSRPANPMPPFTSPCIRCDE